MIIALQASAGIVKHPGLVIDLAMAARSMQMLFLVRLVYVLRRNNPAVVLANPSWGSSNSGGVDFRDISYHPRVCRSQ